ncbi:anti-sigma factor family protein [Streptomyces sp. enrichment culture]|uniref:anti-sigma factor family protein n=1 Tax=Streptomyces sp. enrichment culture TaxID=1795815 RepID=UPI003F55C9BA
MSGHPDVTEISDLVEGLLPPARTTDVRRHLDTCELCADVYASLEEIRGLLGAVPGPPRMPADVAGRIDAALAAEALLSATAPEPGEASAAGAAPSEPQRNDRAPVSRETPAPADRPAGSTRHSTTGPGRKDGRRGGRRRLAVLGAAFAAAALGLGTVIVSSLDDGTPPGEARGPRSSPADTFSEGKLQGQVSALLAEKQGARSESRAPRSLGAQTEPESGSRVFTQSALPTCVQQGIGREDPPLATEEGVYQGREALLLVLSESSDDRRVTVYIVETACVDDPSADAAKVLLKRSYTP